MATIVGAITSSHIPAIGNAMSNDLQREPYWRSFFEGYDAVHEWLHEVQPDVAEMVFNDHG